MTAPLVTVVTPAYQAGSRLGRCLDSVRGQTYSHVEHIVVDGGSTDGSVEVLAGAPDIRWLSEPDRGQSHALNKGFQLARGGIVGWLNADDVLEPTAIARSVAIMQARPEVGWTYGSVKVTGEVSDYVLRPPRRLARRHFFRGTPVAQPGAFFARWALDRAGPLAEDLHYAMDLDLWCRLYVGGVASVRVDGPVAIFEVHADSKSGSIDHHLFVEDQANALQRNLLHDVAAATYGRAAALRSWTGRRVDAAILARDLADLRLRLEAPTPAHETLMRIGARTEEALLLLKARDPRGVLLLGDPRIWAAAAGRERVAAAVQAMASRSRRPTSPGQARPRIG